MSGAPFPLSDDKSRYSDWPALWIPPFDSKGNPVDERFVRAAQVRVHDMMRYRASDLRDDAVRLNLIERAVHRASRARTTSAILDYEGYLLRVFARVVEAEVRKERRYVYADSKALEELVARRAARELKPDRDIETGQLLDAMDEYAREVWSLRLEGYTDREIAWGMRITDDCLYARMKRGFKAVVQKVLPRRDTNERK